VPDLYAVSKKDAGSGRTAYHIINGASPYHILQSAPTALHQTDDNWEFEVADHNRDGMPDLYAITRYDPGSGRTAYHVLNAPNPSQYLVHAATALHPTDQNWDFEVADYNRDGVPDLYAVNKQDCGSGRTAYHVLNGTNPGQFLLHRNYAAPDRQRLGF
jgi:hypothetical protein